MCFLKPPFYSVARRVAGGETFWTWPCASPQQIDFEKTICVADFGLGTDAPIVLDYSLDAASPRVLWLRWMRAPPGEPGGRDSRANRWSQLTETFDEFASLLGLA